MNQVIYMDHAATTKAKSEVVEAMLPFFHDKFGNPSSVYQIARENREAINQIRDEIGASINTDGANIYFTAGGSESDNWALKETALAYGQKKKHMITTKIEHHAILHTAKYLESQGFTVTYLDVDEQGLVDIKSVEQAIRPETILISVMFANNEIGTIQPIAEIGALAHKHNILFHTDAVQAYGQIPIDVQSMNIDLLSASGHKLNGPKGIGFLYIREGLSLGSFIHGGGQEQGRRGGTENVPGIIGLGKAVEIAFKGMEKRRSREEDLRDYAIERILHEIPYSRLNGHRRKRLPNNINISFQFIEGESMLVMLDMKGICASSGSACTSGSTSPSHVLLALGLPNDIAQGSLRLTLGEENTKEEMDYVVDCLKEIVSKLREMSPLYEDYIRANHIGRK